MSGLYFIQVAMCFCFMGGYYGQPLYEDRCRNNLVDGMDQRLKEAYDRDVLLQTQVDNLKNQLDIVRGTVEFLQFHRMCLNENGTYYEENSFKNQYCFIKTSLTWNDAKKKCESFKSYLLEINSKAEQNWLKDKVSGGYWWTGAIKDRNKNIWVWDHSDSKLVFTNWDSKDSQPNGESKEKDENCVLSECGFWHDYPCQNTFNMICERGE